MNSAANHTSLSRKDSYRAVAAIESQARAALSEAPGRACVSVTIGEVVVTEWLTAEDAARAARFFESEMGKVTRLSYDRDLGWVCEAAEEF